jgi:hypothetical protein
MASFGRAKLAHLSDGLLVAVAVSLPWSTSLTAILVKIWTLALIPTLDLFDFVQGWVYVIGVGVAGGMVLKARAAKGRHGAAP